MSVNTNFQIHGFLSAIAFGAILPISAIIARYYKTHKYSAWLSLHSALMLISFGLLVGGMVVLDLNSDGLFSTHGLLGITLLIGVVIQIGLGAKSAHAKCEDIKVESTFETGHKNLAVLVVSGGIVNIFLGFDLLKNDAKVIGGFTAWLLLMVAFTAFLEWKKGRASRYSTGSIFKPTEPALGFSSEKPKTFKDSKSPFMYRPSWNKQGGKNDSLIAETLARSRNSSIGPRPGIKVVASSGGTPKSRQSSATKPAMAEREPQSPAMLAERISVLDKLTQKLLDSRKPSTNNVSRSTEPKIESNIVGTGVESRPSTPIPDPMEEIDLREKQVREDDNVAKKKKAICALDPDWVYTLHGQAGILTCAALTVQIVLGIICSKSYDADAKTESGSDRMHGVLGKMIILMGAADILLGIQQLHSTDVGGSRVYLAGFAILTLAWSCLGFSLETKYGRSTRYFSQSLGASYGFPRKKSSISSEEEISTVRGSALRTSKVLTIETAFKNMEEKIKSSPMSYRPSWETTNDVKGVEKVVQVEEFKKRPSQTKTPRESKLQIREPSCEKVDLKKMNSSSSLSSTGSSKMTRATSQSLLKMQNDGQKGALQKLAERFGSGDLATFSRSK